MDIITRLERVVLRWARNLPHLPVAGQKWLGENVWWIVLIIAIITGISFLVALAGLFTLISLIGSVSSTYFVTGDHLSLGILNATVGLVFLLANGILLATAIKPLQQLQKKGWVLIFVSLLVEALSVVASAILSYSVAGFVINLLFGGILLAIIAYLLAEIHSQFGHVIKARAKKD